MSDKLRARIWRAGNARGRFIVPGALDTIVARAESTLGPGAENFD
jgi:hypothetical protein